MMVQEDKLGHLNQFLAWSQSLIFTSLKEEQDVTIIYCLVLQVLHWLTSTMKMTPLADSNGCSLLHLLPFLPTCFMSQLLKAWTKQLVISQLLQVELEWNSMFKMMELEIKYGLFKMCLNFLCQ